MLYRCTNTACTSKRTTTLAQMTDQGSSGVPHHSSLVLDSDRRPVIVLTFINHGQVSLYVCKDVECASFDLRVLGTDEVRDRYLTASVVLRSPGNLPVVVVGDGERNADGTLDDDLEFFYCLSRACANTANHRLTSTSFDYERIFLGINSAGRLIAITIDRLRTHTDGNIR